MDDRIFQHDALQDFSIQVFLAMGCSESDAQTATRVLLCSDLRGIDSHGMARLSGYVRLWKAGRINTQPTYRILAETLSTAALDADAALGLVSAPFAMELAIEKAKKAGSGWVAVSNSNHFGIAAHHTMMALEHDMIGFAVTNASPLVTPTHGAERMLGTNPVCYAFPAGDEPPLVLDMATAAASNGKLEIAERNEKPIPSGWLVDKDGKSSNNPSELRSGGMLLTLGSDAEHGSYKGYGLAAVVDILSGVLSGANYGPWVPPFVSFLPVLPDLPGKGIGHFLGAMRIDGFRPAETFKQHLDQWIRRFRATRPADVNEPVIIPGEPELRAASHRKEHGIPLNEKVIEDLATLAAELKLKHPF